MNRISPEILDSPIEYLKGVGPHRAEMLRKELRIDSFRDLLEFYPYRHIDKSRINTIREITFQHRIYTGCRHSGKPEITGNRQTQKDWLRI